MRDRNPVHWLTLNKVPSLPPAEIHLWWQDLRDRSLDLAALHDLLSERERQRIQRFVVERAKHEFTAARGVFRHLLARYLGRHPRDLEFCYGSLGKPSIPPAAGHEQLCFNYTDSGGCALYAFGWGCELGVDLETLSRRVRYRRIIERRFAARESQALLAIPEAEQLAGFLACWTRKEAYGKALGVGIHFPLDCRELCVDCESSPLTVTDHLAGDRWDIHQLYPSEDFVAALVHPRGSYRQRHFRLAEGTIG